MEWDTNHHLMRIRALLGINGNSPDNFAASIPFSLNDASGGAENELQTVVMGQKDDVDLPITIEKSNYFKNIIKRIRSGETPQKVITELENYLNSNKENVRENSWVRFPSIVLSPYAMHVFNHDSLADKNNPPGPQRGDINKFIFYEKGEKFLRVPASYLLKLYLAYAITKAPPTHPLVRATGEQLLNHFLNDNTSPETFSFHPVPLNSAFEMGKGLARETSKRFLLTQLLTMYANQSFQLLSTGQRALIYFAPHPPCARSY